MSLWWVPLAILMAGFGLFLAYWVVIFFSKTVEEPDFMEMDQVKSNRADKCGQIKDISV